MYAILHPDEMCRRTFYDKRIKMDSINHAKLYDHVFSMLRLYQIIKGANMGTFGRLGCKLRT
jgi:hypothetical protein